MQLQVFVRGVEGGEAETLRRFAKRRFDGGFERYHQHLARATIRLEDETGPRKSTVDKICSVTMTIRTNVIRIRAIGSDFRQVIDSAVERARGVLRRCAGRAKRGVGAG